MSLDPQFSSLYFYLFRSKFLLQPTTILSNSTKQYNAYLFLIKKHSLILASHSIPQEYWAWYRAGLRDGYLLSKG